MGVEPTTCCLRNNGSTIELPRQIGRCVWNRTIISSMSTKCFNHLNYAPINGGQVGIRTRV